MSGEKNIVLWHGLPRSTWAWTAYNLVFIAFASWSGDYAVAILVAVIAIFILVTGARLAYWTERAQDEQRKIDQLQQNKGEKDA